MSEKQPIEIIPAVLPYSHQELEEKLGLILGAAKHVQIDIVDGHFARHKSWPYKDGGKFAQIVEQEHGLPHWEELDFEFDLMVDDPMAVCMDYVKAGASRIIVHAASKSAVPAVQALLELNDDNNASFVVAAGVALNATDSPDVLEAFSDQFDFVQVMGIEHIGKQGEPLLDRAVILVERLRHRFPFLPIQVDGGVKLEHVKRLVAAGATRLVCGSAIFGTEDPKAAYNALYTEANG